MGDVLLYLQNNRILIIVFLIAGLVLLQYMLGLVSIISKKEHWSKLILAKSSRDDFSQPNFVNFIEHELPALPYDFLMRNANSSLQVNSSCAQLPQLFSLKFHNNYWQTYEQQNISYQLFGAYYDNRADEPNGQVIRILSMINGTDDKYPQAYCQLWFEQLREPQIVPVVKHFAIWNYKWGRTSKQYWPNLLMCVLPKHLNDLAPQAVSLVANECEQATNMLKVIYQPLPPGGTKSGFAVCIKAIDYPYADRSFRMVEWLELMRILGAEKVHLHHLLQEHENIANVLKYYQKQRFVQMHAYSMARGEPMVNSFQHMTLKSDWYNKALHEILIYNDCFYRNMYKYEYIVLCDLDEVIMPLGQLRSWQALVDFIKAKQLVSKNCSDYASLCFRDIFFPEHDEIPPSLQHGPSYLHMLQHVYRNQDYVKVGAGTKCFHSTKQVVSLHNHYPRHVFKQSCRYVNIKETVGQMQHFRNPNKPYVEEYTAPVLDANIYRFKELLIARCKKALLDIGLIKQVKINHS